MNFRFSSFLVVVLLSLCFTACIKNTDFDQTENIVVDPIFEINLIHFDLDAQQFYDSINATPILTVRDTTKLKFLDDSTLHENLVRAEFYFKFTNSIPRQFNVDFQFISENNDTTYTTQTQVLMGTQANPKITEFVENVEGDGIKDITLANRIVISVTIPDSNINLQGNLNLKSKAAYYLEIVQ